MVINEHWGKPNSPWPGSLWWEHTNLLKRKPISAGWQSKKAAPWKPTHEFIQISLSAHILDAFRIHCGKDDFDSWSLKATLDDLMDLSKKVYVFSSAAYERQEEAQIPDIVLMNNILYNCDALYYWLLVRSIKAGDIGRVVLVLRIWMVMMWTPKTMPRYANAIFETLGRLQQYPERLRRLFLHNWLVNLTGNADGFKEHLQIFSNALVHPECSKGSTGSPADPACLGSTGSFRAPRDTPQILCIPRWSKRLLKVPCVLLVNYSCGNK